MSVIEGKAKRYDGTAIDYVLLFDWASGGYVGKSVPDAAGNWRYEYVNDLNVGITYVADGCEPITHGAYQFIAEIVTMTSGFLFLSYSTSGGRYYPRYDVTKTTEPTWTEYFAQTKDIALISYNHTAGAPATTTLQEKTINNFDLSWNLLVFGYNNAAPSDSHLMTLEVLDGSDNVLFALKSAKDAYGSGLWYGKTMQSLTKGSSDGSASIFTSGTLSFAAGRVTYTNSLANNYNNSFIYNVDLSNARKIRVAGSSSSTSSAGGEAGGYIRIMPK